MAVRHGLTPIHLDAPYRLGDGDIRYDFTGWARADDPGGFGDLGVRLRLNGIEVPVRYRPAPEGARDIAHFEARADFRTLFAGLAPDEPYLLNVVATAGPHRQSFGYEVSDGWLKAVFGRPVRRRRVPPDHLQIRTLGAAAGQFHAVGRRTADQIASVLDRAGRPLHGHRRILDLGCGPGQVIAAIRDRHPEGELFGSDVDGEAIGWARASLSDIGDFRVAGPTPPLLFADATFDLIYAVRALARLSETQQQEMLAELRRILKPGGLLLVGTGPHGPSPEAGPTEAHVRRVWGAHLDVLHVGADDFGRGQGAALLRRPGGDGGLFAGLLKAFRTRMVA